MILCQYRHDFVINSNNSVLWTKTRRFVLLAQTTFNFIILNIILKRGVQDILYNIEQFISPTFGSFFPANWTSIWVRDFLLNKSLLQPNLRVGNKPILNNLCDNEEGLH